jgi:5-methylthioadenosine/S-adenosylhomocysteine deaminase
MQKQTVTLLVKNAIVVTVDRDRRVFFDGSVVVRDGRFVFVGKAEDALTYLCSEGLFCEEGFSGDVQVVEGEGLVLFPGFVSTHNHLYQTLLKGLGDDMMLADWLRTMTFPASKFITPEDTYHAAIIGLGEGVRSGITTNLDYMYPHPMEGLTDPIIKAYREIGVRCLIGRGGMDVGTEFGVDPGIQQSPEDCERDLIRLFDTYHMKDDGRVRIWAAPAALWSNSLKMLKMLWEVTTHYKSGLTVHISETPFDRESVEKQHGCDELTFLEKHGMVGPNVLMVHSVYLTPEDIMKAKQYGLTISHNTASNMYLSSGTAPVPAMLDAGLVVSLGVDGAASNNGQDMLELMKLTALLHKVTTLDPTIISAEKVLEMATIEGARALMMEDEIGSIEVGKRADFVVFDPLASPKSIPLHNPVSTLVYASTVQNIRDVYVDGKPVVRDGALTAIPDERAAYAKAGSVAENLARRAGIVNRREGHAWNDRYRR